MAGITTCSYADGNDSEGREIWEKQEQERGPDGWSKALSEEQGWMQFTCGGVGLG